MSHLNGQEQHTGLALRPLKLVIELQTYLQTIYPAVQFILSADTSSNLLQQLNQNNLDLIIGVNYKSSQNKQSHYFQLFEDSYSYYKSNKKIQNENSLIIHQNATDENGVKIHEFIKSDLKGKTIHTVQNFETLKQLVISGFGIGILPSLVAKPILALDQIVPHKTSKTKSQFGKHSIGVLARNEVLDSYKEFIHDIIRLGDRWIKT